MLKKKMTLVSVFALVIALLAGCGSSSSSGSGNSTPDAPSSPTSTSQSTGGSGTAAQTIEALKISFVPSKDPDQIITATDPLKELLKSQLASEGFDVGKVSIDVGTTYEAVGEALTAGTTDVGFIPGGTYALYDDGADVILTATRAGLSNDSDQAKDWNDNKPTQPTSDQATYYRALFIAGPSDKGQTLAAKINNGEELTWEELNDANWAVMSTSSSAGYIYPTLWLQDNYNKSITDLSHVVTSDSYGSSFARLAAGQVDIIVAFADARRDYEEQWTNEFGRKQSIWDETNIIGVTQGIYNDTISVSKNSPTMNDELKAALQKAFIAIAQTEEGKNVIAVYSHEGYKEAQPSDYDGERKAQEIIKNLKK
ncbi:MULTISPECIES: phosphate/phosphite/phosphonate ABC transporter substrate-binding protein [Paenibacillus]|uniref:Phosphonate ABC transporter, periplasmic phosphonate-binding protein n=2 Tax=Paenibacillus lactis TaxID=228574 RepID=G4HK17_9BACL|nr:PhnD/SsuA/transferrin family substrate-binding protein [Paenibacillus lactis]EHB62401.1 phosphonate ABC transporter, periplasmic phosphonate-binding protein [Paenibacillus lactis 154]MBP1894061.1 phosphonate transport system substrate-binding protein [Paenibacillus lactis]